MSGKQKNYSPEFKIPVIMDMREHHLGYRETVSISTSPNLQQIRDMLSGLFEKLLATTRPLFIPIRGGSTNTPNTNGDLLNTTLHKVCPEKETVWITA